MKKLLCFSAVFAFYITSAHCCVSTVNDLRELIIGTWQSSSYSSESCSIDKQKQIFFHSAVGIESSDEGYHWFVMKLAEPTLITGLALRAGGRNGTADDIMSRSEDIQVWMSQSDIEFGSEKCRSQSISSVFNSTFHSWSLCGKTGKVRSDGQAETQCSNAFLGQLILLRKYVRNIDKIEGQAMSFNAITYYAAGNVTTSVHPDESILQNSSFTVSCVPKNCADGTVNKLRLCNDRNNSCLPDGILSYHITHAQPSHSANYTCSVHHQVLSVVNVNVLYPPSNVSVFIDESRCNAHSAYVRFAFESSAAHPQPHHYCSAFDSHGNNISLSRNDIGDKSDAGSVRSLWFCLNCNRASNVTVVCRAGQQRQSHADGSWSVLWEIKVEENWNCAQGSGFLTASNLHIWVSIITVLSIAIIISAAVICAKAKAKSQTQAHTRRRPESANSLPTSYYVL